MKPIKPISQEETKEQKRARQDRAFKRMIDEISYKDEGECFRKNMFWRMQGRVEIIS